MATQTNSTFRSFFALLAKVYEAMGKLLMLSPQRDVRRAPDFPKELQETGIERHFEAAWGYLGNVVMRDEWQAKK